MRWHSVACGMASRAHDAVIRVYDEAGNVIETNEQDYRSGGTHSSGIRFKPDESKPKTRLSTKCPKRNVIRDGHRCARCLEKRMLTLN
jgi:hypothetical protein